MSDFDEDVLTIRGNMPLRWERVQNADNLPAVQAMDGNILLLKVLGSLEENRPAHTDPHEGQTLELLLRLESKVNLLFAYLAQILAHNKQLPEETYVVLHADRLSWRVREAIPLGEKLRIELFLHVQIPSPLILYGTVNACTALEEGTRVDILFDNFNPELTDLLEKTIFRHHRREIRRHKGQGATSV